jgi:GMP synthase-like glutamine amidotransferase
MTVQPAESILIVDFGSQVTQLIARRVREAGVYSEIAPFGHAAEAFSRLRPKGSFSPAGRLQLRMMAAHASPTRSFIRDCRPWASATANRR